MERNKDPRKGFTSASNAQADSLCPGRHQAQKGIPDKPGEWSSHGTLIHDALADSTTHSLDRLTPDQRETYDAHREIEKKVITQIWANPDPPQKTNVWRHERYWCTVPVSGTDPANVYKHSGEADFVMLRGKIALIQDYKSLPGVVAESPRNLQLRDLAVMVWRCLKVDEVVVCINQPLVTWNPELCRYTAADLEKAEQEMWQRVRESNNPAAQRRAGDVQCKFCKASGTCKEYATWSAAMLPVKPEDNPFLMTMASWTPDQRRLAADHLPRMKKLIDDTEDFLKSCLKQDPLSVPGFQLKEGQTRESITDPQELFNRFALAGGTLDQFMKAIKVTKGEFEAQLKLATKMKGKELKVKLTELLTGITESNQNAPSLARKAEEQ